MKSANVEIGEPQVLYQPMKVCGDFKRNAGRQRPVDRRERYVTLWCDRSIRRVAFICSSEMEILGCAHNILSRLMRVRHSHNAYPICPSDLDPSFVVLLSLVDVVGQGSERACVAKGQTVKDSLSVR